ncbi:MAG: putative sugar O-methyltransferase [Solirubrobacteraceae bacterium]|nr:putative sugar O-methyltransferase [Solirubrobacteraceae bacterium]
MSDPELTFTVGGLRRRAVIRLQGLNARLGAKAVQRRRKILQHGRLQLLPQAADVVVADKVATAHDVAIAERLLAAHHAAGRSAPALPPAAQRDDLWTMIASRQGSFAAILQRGDAHELATYLCNVSRHDGSVGITQGDAEYARIVNDRSYREFVALMAKDKLVSLAEAVGALPIENPEQGPLGEPIHYEAAEIVERICACVGIDVTPPDVDGGLLKIDTGRGLFGERDANAIYTAHLLRETARDRQAPRICEIGGGSGRVAYWSRRFGLTTYTLIDLPHVNVVQGYYALKSLPADEVSLYGEAPAGAAAGRLQILPDHATAELRTPLFDVVLNQDSFPEMNAATVEDYLGWIKVCCRGSLMSINHESKPPYGRDMVHVSVPEAIAVAGGFERVQRFSYWLRRGYVAELYRITR